MRILIIDDDKDVTKMLSTYLELKNHSCFVANDARTGLELIDDNDYDVILLDLAMPEVSGFDVLDILCENNKSVCTKIVVFTAVPLMGSEKKEILTKGVLSILEKPMNVKSLLDNLEQLTKK